MTIDQPFIKLDPGMSWQHPTRIFWIANQTMEPMYLDHDGIKIEDERAERLLADWRKVRNEEVARNTVISHLSNGIDAEISIDDSCLSIEFSEDGWPRTDYHISVTPDEAIKFGETLISHANEAKRRASPPKSDAP